ncbi:MAG: ribosome biogenesis protein [Candidatus Proteinoplasmatales archaeon SG8-5]|nr:MAG: ribosome biogenesis protein [Candidatus Proteinoplasmatales archaeon SG8-5]
MSSRILKCVDCGSYTLKKECACGGSAVTPHPPRFSPEDRYGKYRRQLKALAKEG